MRSFASIRRGSPAVGNRNSHSPSIRRTHCPQKPRLEEVDRLAGIASENVYLRLAAKEEYLSRYGETAEKGFVHIPIRRAMETLAGHLPVRKEQPAATKDNGLVDSGASNSGRMFRGASR